MFKTEFIEKKQSALILTDSFGKVYRSLKAILESRNIKVYSGEPTASFISTIDYLFFINPRFKKIKHWIPKVDRALIIFTERGGDLEKTISFLSSHKKTNVKVVSLNTHSRVKENIERALWFFFSNTDEIYLSIGISEKKKKKSFRPTQLLSFFRINISPRRAAVLVFFGFLAYNFIIWVIYGTALAFTIKSLRDSKKLIVAENLYRIAYKGYEPVRPVYHLFFLGSLADRNFKLEQTSIDIAKEIIRLQKSVPEFFSLFLKPSPEDFEVQKQKELIGEIKDSINTLNSKLLVLESSIPKFVLKDKVKDKIKVSREIVGVSKDLFSYLEELFPNKTKKKYLIVFANNMELRPGGGFIGSFAVLETRYLGVSNIRIYDVYDADGQLRFHIEPPEAIKKYLDQPHWFFRDSNFSPDMLENYQVAKKFLKMELNENDFSGMVVITTSAIEKMLGAFGEIYLPDYNETITKENFYIKTQFYTQKNFFPGSLNKKRFLSSLMNQFIANIDLADPVKLLLAIKEALDEKFIAAYFENQSIQQIFNKYYWSGRIISPKCLVGKSQNCVLDYFFPVDANLGVNKANFYIKKAIEVVLKIDKDGSVVSNFKYSLRNDSPAETFPGGTYKNYFRLFVLKNIELAYAKANDRRIGNLRVLPYDSFEGVNNLGFVEILLKVPPQGKKEFWIEFKHKNKLRKGSNLYQLIIQKQIGGQNYDFSLKIILPDNIHLVNQNFTPLVKKGEVLYNTYLSTDKIFFLELVKE